MYDPRNKINGINLKKEAIEDWVKKGAQLSDTVKKLLKTASQSAPAQ